VLKYISRSTYTNMIMTTAARPNGKLGQFLVLHRSLVAAVVFASLIASFLHQRRTREPVESRTPPAGAARNFICKAKATAPHSQPPLPNPSNKQTGASKNPTAAPAFPVPIPYYPIPFQHVASHSLQAVHQQVIHTPTPGPAIHS